MSSSRSHSFGSDSSAGLSPKIYEIASLPQMKTVNSKVPNAIENLNLYGSLLNVLPSKHDSKIFMTNQNNFGESLRSINHN